MRREWENTEAHGLGYTVLALLCALLLGWGFLWVIQNPLPVWKYVFGFVAVIIWVVSIPIQFAASNPLAFILIVGFGLTIWVLGRIRAEMRAELRAIRYTITSLSKE